MIEKPDNTHPIQKDWEEACREVHENAPDYYKDLKSIQPWLPEPRGNTTDIPSVYFTQENAKRLKSIVEQLPEKAIKYCTTLMRLYAKAYCILPQTLGIAEGIQLPADVTEQQIASKMDRRTLSALMSTCSFFYTSQSLRARRDSLPKYQVCTGSSFTLISTHNKLLVCGTNYWNELGLGHSTPQHSFIDALSEVLLKGESILQIAAGAHHTAVLTSQRRLLMCGHASDGQLGLRVVGFHQPVFIDVLEKVLLNGESVLEVVTGYDHTMVLTSKHRLLVSGNNSCGRLGLGHTYEQHSFTDALAGVLLEEEVVLEVIEGNYHTLVLTSQHRLLVSGSNSYGQLGPNIPDTNKIFTDALKGVLLQGEAVLQVAAGRQQTLVLTSHHRLLMCGNNQVDDMEFDHTYDQRGFIDVLAGVLQQGETVLQMAAGNSHSLVLTNQNRLLVSGKNSCGQLGLGHKNRQIIFIDALAEVLQQEESVLQVVAKEDHTLLLTSQNRLLVCGDNKYSQLGLGEHIKEQHSFIDALTGLLRQGEAVLQVTAGQYNTFIVTSHQRLLVCGSNPYGMLGLGHTDSQLGFISHPLFDDSLLLLDSAPLIEEESASKESENSNNCCIQ